MHAILEGWASHGIGGFTVDWLLRVVTGLLTEQSRFEALSEVTAEQFRDGLMRAKKAVDTTLNALGSRLGINDASVLPSPFAMVPLALYADRHGNALGDHAQRDRLLFWYLHASMWGRYTGPTETVLRQDLKAVADGGTDPTPALLAHISQSRGDLAIRPADFIGFSRGSRFYPILYVLSRVTDTARTRTSRYTTSSRRACCTTSATREARSTPSPTSPS